MNFMKNLIISVYCAFIAQVLELFSILLTAVLDGHRRSELTARLKMSFPSFTQTRSIVLRIIRLADWVNAISPGKEHCASTVMNLSMQLLRTSRDWQTLKIQIIRCANHARFILTCWAGSDDSCDYLGSMNFVSSVWTSVLCIVPVLSWLLWTLRMFHRCPRFSYICAYALRWFRDSFWLWFRSDSI